MLARLELGTEGSNKSCVYVWLLFVWFPLVFFFFLGMCNAYGSVYCNVYMSIVLSTGRRDRVEAHAAHYTMANC